MTREDFDTDQFRVKNEELPLRGDLQNREPRRSKWTIIVEPARFATGDMGLRVDPTLFSNLSTLSGFDLALGLSAREGREFATRLRRVVDVLADLIDLADEGRGLVSRRIKNE